MDNTTTTQDLIYLAALLDSPGTSIQESQVRIRFRYSPTFVDNLKKSLGGVGWDSGDYLHLYYRKPDGHVNQAVCDLLRAALPHTRHEVTRDTLAKHLPKAIAAVTGVDHRTVGRDLGANAPDLSEPDSDSGSSKKQVPDKCPRCGLRHKSICTERGERRPAEVRADKHMSRSEGDSGSGSRRKHSDALPKPAPEPEVSLRDKLPHRYRHFVDVLLACPTEEAAREQHLLNDGVPNEHMHKIWQSYLVESGQAES